LYKNGILKLNRVKIEKSGAYLQPEKFLKKVQVKKKLDEFEINGKVSLTNFLEANRRKRIQARIAPDINLDYDSGEDTYMKNTNKFKKHEESKTSFELGIDEFMEIPNSQDNRKVNHSESSDTANHITQNNMLLNLNQTHLAFPDSSNYEESKSFEVGSLLIFRMIWPQKKTSNGLQIFHQTCLSKKRCTTLKVNSDLFRSDPVINIPFKKYSINDNNDYGMFWHEEVETRPSSNQSSFNL